MLTRILIISHDVVGPAMAGPGIRYYSLALVLADEFAVTLAVPATQADPLDSPNTSGGPPGFIEPGSGKTGRLKVQAYLPELWPSLQALIENADVLLLNGYIIFKYPQLFKLDIPIIVDGYDPLLAEWLAATQNRPEEQVLYWGEKIQQLMPQYLLGDFYICASERQRDWWLGLLENSGRINPWTVAADPSLRQLVDVVPFGLPSEAPRYTRPIIRGVWPGISAQDRLILWGGGLWLWLDPITAVRAVGRIRHSHPDVRLIFPGTNKPVAGPAQPLTHLESVRQESERLGLLDRAVFFGDWIDYQDWPNVLLESNLAISLHFADHLETHLAFRARIMDCIWAGLPLVATRGDATSEIIGRYELGVLVDSQDVDGVAQALVQILEKPRSAYQPAFEAARRLLTWENAARPLQTFCRAPRRAKDREALGAGSGNPYYLAQLQRLKQEKLQLQAEFKQLESAHQGLQEQSTSQIQQLQTQNAHLQDLVQAFEQRRIVRLLNHLVDIRHKLLG
jgi:glycosyltransferase involved in cell wall biosynthesis